MKVIPAVDVLEGRVVRLARGSYEEVSLYGEDPAAQVRTWSDLGAELVHVVDLNAARSGVPDMGLIEAIGDTGAPFQIGGGIRSVEVARTALSRGATRLVVGTTAVWEAAVVGSMVAEVGAERVVAALDVESGKARGAGWLDGGVAVEEVAGRLTACGVVRALVTGIAGDGMMTGPDLEVLQQVRQAAPDMALIASGGVGSLADIADVRDAGVEAVIVGRALYEGRFGLEEAMRIAGGQSAA